MQFDILNNSLVDVQTMYGQGRDGVHTTGFANRTFDSWGAKLDGSMKEQFDGVSRPYSYTGDNQDKFYRVGAEQTRTTKGTGLGLYLCKKIVTFHNGAIFIKPNQPKGSIFVVQLKAD